MFSYQQKESGTDRWAMAFIVLALLYLLIGLLFGVLGGMQYVLPAFLKEQLSFQKTRPLHVYLVISWIFTAAQGGIYYFIPRITSREFFSKKAVIIHFWMQCLISGSIIICFLLGYFGGREYLEFPPLLGAFIFISWIPFAINFFMTLRPKFSQAPVYIWSWSTGILFFFITLSESYLWVLDFFRNNIVRDITVQWKALGSMVGSWNMLVYGTGMYIMEKISGNKTTSRSKLAFFFYFLGLTNLMFNWGHHTYIVPAASWVKTVSYVISMTELLILGHIIYKWKSTLNEAQKHYHHVPYRFLSFADAWIFLNLTLALIISVPAINRYTHGTHITVAHAMGATIGINTMLLFAAVYFLIQDKRKFPITGSEKSINAGLIVTNTSLLIFWISLLGMGLVKISGNSGGLGFYDIMDRLMPWFRVFSITGVFTFIGIGILSLTAIRLLLRNEINTDIAELTKISSSNE